MIKIFSEFSTNIIILSRLNDETIIEIITEFQNIAVIVVVRVVWFGFNKLYQHIRKNRKNGRNNKTD